MIGLLLERERDVLQQGAILVDDTAPGNQPRALFYLVEVIQDSTPTIAGERRVISREVHFVEIDAEVSARSGADRPRRRPGTAAPAL